MTKRLVIFLNGKRAVGKSFFTTNFVQYLKDRKPPHHTIDTDNKTTFKRYDRKADFVDLHDPRGLDRLSKTESPSPTASSKLAMTPRSKNRTISCACREPSKRPSTGFARLLILRRSTWQS